MPQNPATLIWVQVTQIHKKEDKIRRLKLHFSKRATKVSTSSALRCFLFVFFTAVARGSSLGSQTDRIKAHSLSLLVRRHHHHHHQPSVD